MADDDRIMMRNPNTGRDDMRIARSIYEPVRAALLAAIELVLHFLIDYAKCEEWISFTMDQSLHRLCKLLYAVLLLINWPAFLDWNPL